MRWSVAVLSEMEIILVANSISGFWVPGARFCITPPGWDLFAASIARGVVQPNASGAFEPASRAMRSASAPST